MHLEPPASGKPAVTRGMDSKTQLEKIEGIHLTGDESIVMTTAYVLLEPFPFRPLPVELRQKIISHHIADIFADFPPGDDAVAVLSKTFTPEELMYPLEQYDKQVRSAIASLRDSLRALQAFHPSIGCPDEVERCLNHIISLPRLTLDDDLAILDEEETLRQTQAKHAAEAGEIEQLQIVGKVVEVVINRNMHALGKFPDAPQPKSDERVSKPMPINLRKCRSPEVVDGTTAPVRGGERQVPGFDARSRNWRPNGYLFEEAEAQRLNAAGAKEAIIRAERATADPLASHLGPHVAPIARGPIDQSVGKIVERFMASSRSKSQKPREKITFRTLPLELRQKILHLSIADSHRGDGPASTLAVPGIQELPTIFYAEELIHPMKTYRDTLCSEVNDLTSWQGALKAKYAYHRLEGTLSGIMGFPWPDNFSSTPGGGLGIDWKARQKQAALAKITFDTHKEALRLATEVQVVVNGVLAMLEEILGGGHCGVEKGTVEEDLGEGSIGGGAAGESTGELAASENDAAGDRGFGEGAAGQGWCGENTGGRHENGKGASGGSGDGDGSDGQVTDGNDHDENEDTEGDANWDDDSEQGDDEDELDAELPPGHTRSECLMI